MPSTSRHPCSLLVTAIGKLLSGIVYFLSCIGLALEFVENAQARITRPFKACYKAIQGIGNLCVGIVDPLYKLVLVTSHAVVTLSNGINVIGQHLYTSILALLYAFGVLFTLFGEKLAVVIVVIKQLHSVAAVETSPRKDQSLSDLKKSRSS